MVTEDYGERNRLNALRHAQADAHSSELTIAALRDQLRQARRERDRLEQVAIEFNAKVSDLTGESDAAQEEIEYLVEAAQVLGELWNGAEEDIKRMREMAHDAFEHGKPLTAEWLHGFCAIGPILGRQAR